ncbi:hypothetical protein ANANG_G00086430 [Anguilla anguilla]|uniref:LEM domain-containing protein n=1 Tax=Anguilla anguilla TaxID=7936 RepID=A0A9D3S158_ANGAN|nr:hypothetical protein ANANG_G00086430 [Anguilla anguilla]
MHSNRKNLATQLSQAVRDGEPRAVENLLSRGANPNLILRKGVAAVHLAVGIETEKRIRCLKLLLQHGADPNVRSVEDLTPLHVAALWGCYQNLKLLLQNGGDPSLKDQDGNQPVDLANQQENSKCAQLLQEYQSLDGTEAEEEDLPQFQYSFYRGHGSKVVPSSSCMEESTSASENSRFSDFNEGPLSSTRRSSCLNLSGTSNRPRFSGLSDITDLHLRRTLEWDRDSDWGVPSVLYSTRMSAAGSRAPSGTLPILQEGVALPNCSLLPSKDLDISAIQRQSSVFPHHEDPPCYSRLVSRKSVTFKDTDEYFPVFSADSPRKPVEQESSSLVDTTVDFSTYPNFLDSERTATLQHHQGIDVTSPDHVFVFSRDIDCASPDLDKTVMGHWLMEGGEMDEGGGEEFDKVIDPVQPPHSSGSSSGASQYSSCDSDQYTSALEPPLHHRCIPPSTEDAEKRSESRKCGTPPEAASFILPSSRAAPQEPTFPLKSLGAESLYPVLGEELKEHLLSKGHSHNDGYPALPNVPILWGSDPSNGVMTEAELPAMMNDLQLCAKSPLSKTGEDLQKGLVKAFSDTVPAAQSEREEDLHAGEFMHSSRASGALAKEEIEFPLTPSPFVTGRTRSRMSRSSLRTTGSPHTPLSASSLFDVTLSPPTRRLRRNNTGRTCDRQADGLRCTPNLSSNGLGAAPANAEIQGSQESETCSLRADGHQSSQRSDSQADTLIISRSMADTVIISGSLADTVILEDRNGESVPNSSGDGQVETSPSCPSNDVIEEKEFLTDDQSSLNGEGPNEVLNLVPPQVSPPRPNVEESWITDDVESSDSQSELHYTSPEPRKEPPATPASGGTPRYSMSRLSACHKPQTLANLSYTPGGRPLIVDVDEPVEYLYTDVEQGHELIECHLPPTANTSLSSNTSSSEDTVLYDWRSAMLGLGKENHLCQEEVLPDTKGLTDKELRCRLKELGEDPGPINRRTRPVYIQRLHRLQMKPNSQQPANQNSGYSTELAAALDRFALPNCFDEEMALCQQFDQPDQNRKWREGIIKSSFNYLLLDPRVTKNLPYRSQSMTPAECFQTFVGAIFYVGKGKRSRPYSHLYEALEYYRGDKISKKLCSKVQHILQVWNAGQGVISLHCFQNVIPVEAYTREACMVDAIGLKMLTNQKRGDYYGIVATWPLKQRRELGVHLLFRAMQIFLAEGERQLRPVDIRAGQ